LGAASENEATAIGAPALHRATPFGSRVKFRKLRHSRPCDDFRTINHLSTRFLHGWIFLETSLTNATRATLSGGSDMKLVN
jgi:hypothetical protein